MKLAIGVWAKRPGGKWHLVESVVAEDAVTRCGRRMDRVASRGELQISDVMPLTRLIGQPQLCRGGCQRINGVDTRPRPDLSVDSDPAHDFDGLDPFAADDDASTHDESEPA